MNTGFSRIIAFASQAAALSICIATTVFAQGAPAVTVEIATAKPTSTITDFSGKTITSNAVDLTARVEGILQEIGYSSGAYVKQGAVLFSIDPAELKIALAQAEGAVEVAEAAAKLAEAELERAKQLTDRNVASPVQMLEAEAALQQAGGNLKIAQAARDAAELRLDLSQIRAPFDGYVEAPTVSAGALIGPSSGRLTTIYNNDPILISFRVPLSRFTDFIARGNTLKDREVEVILPNGTPYPVKGLTSYSASSADLATNTVEVRATLVNPDYLLLHNQKVTVRVTEVDPEMKVTLSQSALLLDQQGPYVLVADSNDTAQMVRPNFGDAIGNRIEVLSGLEDGVRVIVTGLARIRPGMTVTVEATQ